MVNGVIEKNIPFIGEVLGYNLTLQYREIRGSKTLFKNRKGTKSSQFPNLYLWKLLIQNE